MTRWHCFIHYVWFYALLAAFFLDVILSAVSRLRNLPEERREKKPDAGDESSENINLRMPFEKDE